MRVTDEYSNDDFSFDDTDTDGSDDDGIVPRAGNNDNHNPGGNNVFLTPHQSLVKISHHIMKLMMTNNNRMMTKVWHLLLQIHNASNWTQHLSWDQERLQEWI